GASSSSAWPSATVLFSLTSHLLTRPACSATTGICIFMASMMPISLSASIRSPTLTRHVMRSPDTGEETARDTRVGSTDGFTAAQEHVGAYSARHRRALRRQPAQALLPGGNAHRQAGTLTARGQAGKAWPGNPSGQKR